MSQPIVIAHHLIWTAYGWWLPNDPRGSGSKVIRSDIIAQLGALHCGRKRVQPPGSEVRRFYKEAKAVLKHPLLTIDGSAREEIASAFAQVIQQQQYTCYACAIMPDHVHILIRKHKHSAEKMAEILKDTSRSCLRTLGHRTADHPTWTAGDGWKVFLDHPDEVRGTIKYIRFNPLPYGLPEQSWSFVKRYDGWPLHRGHSPNSPYVQRLRAAGRYP
jgi:REP element-mobilizing transposase RayT